MVQRQAEPSQLKGANETSPAELQYANANGKRVRNDTSPERLGPATRRSQYPRKRAVTACQVCRARKTKCDNQRPSCGFCVKADAKCSYEDRFDHSSFDPASLELLERLHRVEQQQTATLAVVCNIERGLGHEPGPFSNHDFTTPSTQPAIHVLDVDLDANVPPTNIRRKIADQTAADQLNTISSHNRPDAVLTWPIFEDRYPSDYLQSAVFELSCRRSDDEASSKPRHIGSGFCEDEVFPLMERFLSYVHTKNPILDEDYLRREANRIVEDGLSWDAASCLILLVCALGSICTPFEEARQTAMSQHQTSPNAQSIDERARVDKAETYYSLARRRIGTLDQSILASQCYFILGIYLMFALRPVEAFQAFHQSSIIYQICARSTHSPEKTSKRYKLEQRLYWSCFKSECEILSEISLPDSGILGFNHSQTFPCPPSNLNTSAASPVLDDTTDESPLSTLGYGSRRRHRDSAMGNEQEQGWYYYLSEIALRRIGNRVLGAFYVQESFRWFSMDISRMIKVAEEFLRQLDEWRDQLPPPISYKHYGVDEIPREELVYQIRTRELEIRSWILRPFLFCAVHLPLDHPDQAVLSPLVDQSTRCCAQVIEANAVRHRHHGTWYVNRLSVTAALGILVAAKKGFRLPHDWQAHVQVAIETLCYWEAESPGDITKARVILEELLTECVSASS